MSRRSKRTDPKSDQAALEAGKRKRRCPPRRGLAALPELMLARRPAAPIEAPSPLVATPLRAATVPVALASTVPPSASSAKRTARIIGAPAIDESELERLKRLEDRAEEAETRARAAELRRVLRT